MTDILVDRNEAEQIATVTISNPERRNALDSAGSEDLAAAFRDLDADDDVRCIVLTGDGDAFCAGADLAGGEMSGAPTAQSIDRGFHEAVRQIMTCSKPVVAKVSGPAVGAGACIATACDFVYADESARVGFVFASLGLTADSGATYILPRLVGVRDAMALLSSADILDAEAADEMGLTTDVVPASDLDDRVHERAVELASGPTRSIAALRRLLLRSNTNTLEEQLELESREQEIMFHTDDVSEGMAAFQESRSPEFEGR